MWSEVEVKHLFPSMCISNRPSIFLNSSHCTALQGLCCSQSGGSSCAGRALRLLFSSQSSRLRLCRDRLLVTAVSAEIAQSWLA